MRIRLVIVFILLLISPLSSAEQYCHGYNCFTNRETITLNGEDLHVYYNSLFTIGENWFVVFHLTITDNASDRGTRFYIVDLSFEDGTSKNLSLSVSYFNFTDSVSFPGSTFASENFDFDLYLTISGDYIANSTFKIDINKPPADDMLYLWGGMTVFWAAIGAYVIYLSIKLKGLSDRMERL